MKKEDFNKCFYNFWEKYLLPLAKTLITISLPTTISLIYTIPPFKEFVKKILDFLGLLNYCKQHQILLIILIVIIIPILITIRTINKDNKKDKQFKNLNDCLKLLNVCIDDVVKTKTKRFVDYANNETLQKEKIFLDITRPDIQMTQIISQLNIFFRMKYQDETINVNLLKVQDRNRIEHFVSLSGQKTDDSILCKKESTAKACFNSKEICIIENTDKEHSHFVQSDNKKIKSIICYPIQIDSKVKYIISITSSRTKTFKKSQKELYEYVLEQFSNRIILENSLDTLKEKAHA